LKTHELLHYAFRARFPDRLAAFYADLFEARYFLHPVMTGLGIVIIKLNHPESLFDGLLEFWPWDVVWDRQALVFRRVEPRPSPTSYGHLAVKVAVGTQEIVDELRRRGIPFRMEPRLPGVEIPTIDDPEGNMIELFPDVGSLQVPPDFICSPTEAVGRIAVIRALFNQAAEGHPPDLGYSLTFGQE
jgi:hypothetical protein